MVRGKLHRASLKGGAFGVAVLLIACVVSASAPAAGLPTLDPSSPSLPQALPRLPVLQQQAPSLPQAPALPSFLPQLPSAPAPSPRTAPSLPLPKPPSLLPDARRPAVPSAPGGGSSSPVTGRNEGGATPGSRSGLAVGTTPGAPSAAGPGGSGTRAAVRGESSAQRAKVAGRRARADRLRRAVGRLRGCFYAISRSERQVLILRAGLGGSPALSGREVARRLGVSTVRVRSLERRGLRRLRSAGRTDGCGRPAPAVGPGSALGTVFVELRSGPRPLLPTTQESPPAAKRQVASDEGAALGTSRSTGSRPQPKVAGLGLDNAGGSQDADESLLPAIAAGLALLTLLLAVVLFRRRPERGLADTGPAAAAPPWRCR